MGWQDRDYARQGSNIPHFFYSQGPRWLIGGSIVTTLIAINVAIFVVESMIPGASRYISGDYRRALAGFAELRGDLVAHGQLWRLFTAQYLHASIGHLFINMLVLHFLGRSLERLWSIRRFFWVYTICGIAGNLFYTLLTLQGVIHPDMPAVGASGSIYGLLGIVAVLFPSATVYVYFLFPIRIRTAAFIFGGIALLRVLNKGSNFGGEACHLSGLLFGVWWAMKGDAWWATTQWRFLRRRSPGGGSTARAGIKSKFRPSPPKYAQKDIDRILKKVYQTGVQSLTESEKRMLAEATEQQQRREEAMDSKFGRIDKL